MEIGPARIFLRDQDGVELRYHYCHKRRKLNDLRVWELESRQTGHKDDGIRHNETNCDQIHENNSNCQCQSSTGNEARKMQPKGGYTSKNNDLSNSWVYPAFGRGQN